MLFLRFRNWLSLRLINCWHWHSNWLTVSNCWKHWSRPTLSDPLGRSLSFPALWRIASMDWGCSDHCSRLLQSMSSRSLPCTRGDLGFFKPRCHWKYCFWDWRSTTCPTQGLRPSCTAESLWFTQLPPLRMWISLLSSGTLWRRIRLTGTLYWHCPVLKWDNLSVETCRWSLLPISSAICGTVQDLHSCDWCTCTGKKWNWTLRRTSHCWWWIHWKTDSAKALWRLSLALACSTLSTGCGWTTVWQLEVLKGSHWNPLNWRLGWSSSFKAWLLAHCLHWALRWRALNCTDITAAALLGTSCSLCLKAKWLDWTLMTCLTRCSLRHWELHPLELWIVLVWHLCHWPLMMMTTRMSPLWMLILGSLPTDVASLSSFESASERLPWAANCKVFVELKWYWPTAHSMIVLIWLWLPTDCWLKTPHCEKAWANCRL